jgi:nucleotide-binding universal stress UspA family protein
LTSIKGTTSVANRLNADQEEAVMYKKILVPTDGSELSEQAVAAAIDFARACAAEIVALSVAEPYPLVAAEGAMVIDLGTEMNERRQIAQANVDRVALAAKSAGVSCTTATAYSALPHEEIINAANENKCDLIFMASHGRHGLSRLLAGSTTQKVLADCTIPVLVLRPKAADHHPGIAQTQANAP